MIDGRVAFIGGAGLADWWLKPTRRKPVWRDMMARVEGPVVASILGIVAENWLACCGEILTGPDVYKPRAKVGTDGGVRAEELAGRSRDGITRPVPDPGRRRRPARSASPRRIFCRTRRSGAL